MYRGYNIDELVQHKTWLEVAFLLNFGHIPAPVEARNWNQAFHKALEPPMEVFDVVWSFKYGLLFYTPTP